jgi:hypothetical protein
MDFSTSALAAQSTGSSDSPVADAPSQSAITSSAELAMPAVPGLTAAALSATFSVLPLAIKEFPLLSPDTPSLPQTLPHPFARPGDLRRAVIEPVQNGIASAAASTRTVMVNLFHVDALATFRDAMGAFIDDSAAGSVRRAIGHRRAWTVTAAVLAADAALLAYWFAARRVQTSDQGESTDRPRPRLSLGMAALQR